MKVIKAGILSIILILAGFAVLAPHFTTLDSFSYQFTSTQTSFHAVRNGAGFSGVVEGTLSATVERDGSEGVLSGNARAKLQAACDDTACRTGSVRGNIEIRGDLSTTSGDQAVAGRGKIEGTFQRSPEGGVTISGGSLKLKVVQTDGS